MTRRSKESKIKKGILKAAPVALQSLIHTRFPYALLHSCGFAAFYLRREPAVGEILNPEDCIYPNGDMPKQGDAAVCFNCKKILTHADLLSGNVQRMQ